MEQVIKRLLFVDAPVVVEETGRAPRRLGLEIQFNDYAWRYGPRTVARSAVLIGLVIGSLLMGMSYSIYRTYRLWRWNQSNYRLVLEQRAEIQALTLRFDHFINHRYQQIAAQAPPAARPVNLPRAAYFRQFVNDNPCGTVTIERRAQKPDIRPLFCVDDFILPARPFFIKGWRIGERRYDSFRFEGVETIVLKLQGQTVGRLFTDREKHYYVSPTGESFEIFLRDDELVVAIPALKVRLTITGGRLNPSRR